MLAQGRGRLRALPGRTDMSESMKRQFLACCHEQADRICQESLDSFREGMDKKLADMADTLLGPMEEGLCRFHALEDAGEAGPLRYLYLSWLRSGVLCNRPIQRIDFYDGKGRISLTECAVPWAFTHLYRGLSDIRSCLEERFAGQTLVPGCEMDAILLQKAGRYFREAGRVLPRILARFLTEHGRELLPGRTVDILGGEFLDRVEWMCGWDRDRAVGEPVKEGMP